VIQEKLSIGREKAGYGTAGRAREECVMDDFPFTSGRTNSAMAIKAFTRSSGRTNSAMAIKAFTR